MKRAVIGATLTLASSLSACGGNPIAYDPFATIQSLTVTPDRGRPGTVATVSWVSGELSYSVRLKQGHCGGLNADWTAEEGRCAALVTVADELPASGSRTVVLNETAHFCVFPVRNGGVFPPLGRCVQATVLP